MSFIYNITFFVGKERQEALVDVLRGEFVKAAVEDDCVRFLHLTRVVNSRSMGIMEGEDQAVSVGMQFAVADMAAFELWSSGPLHRAFDLIAARFGDEVLHFDTLLEVL